MNTSETLCRRLFVLTFPVLLLIGRPSIALREYRLVSRQILGISRGRVHQHRLRSF
jgi:hypothetical protein